LADNYVLAFFNYRSFNYCSFSKVMMPIPTCNVIRLLSPSLCTCRWLMMDDLVYIATTSVVVLNHHSAFNLGSCCLP